VRHGMKLSAGAEGFYVLGGVDCAALRVECAQSCVASCGCAVGSNMGVGAGATGTEATEEAVLRRVVVPVQAGVIGARWAVLGGHRLSWAAERKSAPLVGPGSSQLTSMQLRGWC
jgi:hypothetical protein